MIVSNLSGCTSEQLAGFCENMKQSLLAMLAKGVPISVTCQNDTDPVTDDFGRVTDFVLMGYVWSFQVGRQAVAAALEQECQPAIRFTSVPPG